MMQARSVTGRKCPRRRLTRRLCGARARACWIYAALLACGSRLARVSFLFTRAPVRLRDTRALRPYSRQDGLRWLCAREDRAV